MVSPNANERHVSREILLLVSATIAYLMASALTKLYLTKVFPIIGLEQIVDYSFYINIVLALGFGFLIVSIFSGLVYWSSIGKYGHSTASSLRNVSRLLGIGAMVAAIAGGVAGGASGVALGGFLGIVVGFASQQVLGQILAGLLLSVSRPFKIDESVNISSEDGTVENVSTLFTYLKKEDGTRVLIPNNSIIGNKIYLKNQNRQANPKNSDA